MCDIYRRVEVDIVVLYNFKLKIFQSNISNYYLSLMNLYNRLKGKVIDTLNLGLMQYMIYYFN